MRSKTIKIFLKDSDPEGIKIAEISNSIAKVFVIPRSQMDFIKSRPELREPAIYMLFDDERTSVYIGECENFSNRVKDHEAKKSFWQWAVICVTNSSGLNKADVKYLESYSVQRALEVGRFEVQNRNSPMENFLHEFEQAAVMDYFADVELLLSALGYNIFERFKDESKAEPMLVEKVSTNEQRDYDTIVSPCSRDGFTTAFVAQNAWWAVRIGQSVIPKLKHIALYEAAPVSAIRAYAKIVKIEAITDKPGRYKIYHDGDIKYFNRPIELGAQKNLSLQGSRYYLLKDMLASATLAELTDRAYGTHYSAH